MKRFQNIQIGFVAIALTLSCSSFAVINCKTLLRTVGNSQILDLSSGVEYEFGGITKEQKLGILIAFQQQGIELNLQDITNRTYLGEVNAITNGGGPYPLAQTPENHIRFEMVQNLGGGAGFAGQMVHLQGVLKFELLPDTQGHYSLEVHPALAPPLLYKGFVFTSAAQAYRPIAIKNRSAPAPAHIYHTSATPSAQASPYNANAPTVGGVAASPLIIPSAAGAGNTLVMNFNHGASTPAQYQSLAKKLIDDLTKKL